MKAPSPELNLLFISLHLSGDELSGSRPEYGIQFVTEAEGLISRSDIDWELLYLYADSHSVKPQLAVLISMIRTDLVPNDFRKKVADASRQNLVDQLDHLKEFFRVMRRLAGEGVAVVPFKGFWLAEKYYGNLALRESDDIDILVRFEDQLRIRRVMPETGYLVGAPYLKEIDKRGCEFNYGLYSGGRCISHLEFHWRMAPSGFGLDITLDDLESQVVSCEIQGQPLDAFSPCATLLLTVMHHGGKDAFVKLKQVYDIAMILRRGEEIDWQWLFAEARRFRCLNLLGVAAELASVVCGVAVPEQLKSVAGSTRVRRLALERARSLAIPPWERRRFGNQARDWLFRIRSRDGFSVKAGLIWRFVRKGLIPWLIPKRLHPLFIRKYVIPEYAQGI